MFDRLHSGHLFYLKESKKLGDRLIVCVTSDISAKKSGKNPLLDQLQRLDLVSSLKFVDEAFVGKNLGKDWTIYDTLEEVRPDIVALGFDQPFDEKEIEEECVKRGLKLKVVRIGKLPGVKKQKGGRVVIS